MRAGLPRLSHRRGAVALALALAAAVALVALELARGGGSYGEARLHDPCLTRAGASWVLRGLDAAACRRGESREELLLDAADSPIGGIATAVPDLKAKIENWLEHALAGTSARGIDLLEQQLYALLDQLFTQ